ncbi:glycosyltransferase family 2 protein [Patescibacteria group bacterium]|nr:glycosyltransferase family 2 protein [Patescibacteria group bacterium]
MKLSIIIVTWNVKDYLKKCLESIYKNQGDLDVEVIVVDNASTDNTSDMARREFPKVKLITNQNNNGFAKANNQGIKIAKGEYVLFLNPDTEILSNTFKDSIDFFEKHKDTGAVGCQILNTDSTIQRSVRRFPTFWSQMLILYKLHHLLPSLRTFRNYFAQDFDYSKESEVDQIMGAFILTKRDIINKIGDFDEIFYLWFEEVDFCKRLIKNEYKVYYTPKAKIIHHGSLSFNQKLTVEKQKIFNKSMRYYFKKHHNKFSWFMIASTHFDSLFLAFFAGLFKKKNGN